MTTKRQKTYFCINFLRMDYTTLLNSFLQDIRENPNLTAFKHNEEIVTNALYTQRIAPIMNELDTFPEDRFALLLEREIQNYVAIPAALFTGKIIVPISLDWTEEQRQQVIAKEGLTTYLTAQRMHYYFRMTYEDALDRIDNGLITLRDDQPVAVLYHFDKLGDLSSEMLTFQEIRQNGKKAFMPQETLAIFDFLTDKLR